MRLDCQEFVMSTLSLIQWAMAYRQLRGRAPSLSPKSRPKVHLPAQSVLCLPEILSQPLAQRAKRTGLLMTDASHIMAKPAPQSVALYLPPFSHTGSLPSARTPSSRPTQIQGSCRDELFHSTTASDPRLFNQPLLSWGANWNSSFVKWDLRE